MNRDSINEMEQIQKGLEQFLQQEVKGYQDTASDSRKPKAAEDAGRERELQLDFLTHDRDQTDVHMSFDHTSDSGENRGDDLVRERSVRGAGHEESVQRSQDKRKRDPENVSYINETGREKAVKKESESETGRKKKKNNRQENSKRNSKKGGKNDAPPPKKKKSRIKRFLFSILIIFLVLAGLWYWMISSVYGKVNYKEVEAFAGEPMKEDGVTNILLIGNDSRSEGEDGRSDAMILLSISSQTNSIHMTSLLRDMYVEIPGHKGNRLNAAYSYGGAQLLMETIELNLGISVNRYVLVNFQAFANLIDAVGGIELELTNEEVVYINGYLVEYNILTGSAEGTDYLDDSLSGMVHLNGPQALAYTRNRYLGTDFGRTQRQRNVLTAAIKKLPMALITKPKMLTDGLLPNLTTNLTKGECLQLSLMGGKLLTNEIIAASIPVEGSYKNKDIRGMAVLEVDFEKNKEYIRTNIYGK